MMQQLEWQHGPLQTATADEQMPEIE